MILKKLKKKMIESDYKLITNDLGKRVKINMDKSTMIFGAKGATSADYPHF